MTQYINAKVRIMQGFAVSGSVLSGTFLNSGSIPNDWTLRTGSYFLDVTATIQGKSYSSLCTEIETQAADPVVVYDNTLNRVVIDYGISAVPVTASFSVPLAKILGFENREYRSNAGSVQFTASMPPFYLFSSTENGYAMQGGEYHDRDVIEQRYADDGTPFTIKRTGIWNNMDFGFSYELRENAFIRYSASGSNPYTWEHFIKEAQRGKPFVLFHTGTTYLNTGNRDRICILHKDGAKFEPTKEDELLDDYYKIECIALVIPEEKIG